MMSFSSMTIVGIRIELIDEQTLSDEERMMSFS